MSKRSEERSTVLAKTGGRCAYCGCFLTPKTMTVDHVDPIVRPLEQKGNVIVCRSVKGTVVQEGISNKLPACRSCNSYKTSLSLEAFRQRIEHWPDVLESGNSVVRAMIRFGLLELHRSPVLFYFEELEELEAKQGKKEVGLR